MISSVLALSVDDAKRIDAYSVQHSSSIHDVLRDHHKWTMENFADFDRASSILQAQWMMQKASDQKAKKILDIGCYTGLSAVAWYLGTENTGAQICTIEMDEKFVQVSTEAFDRLGFSDRITIMPGEAQNIIENLDQKFDIIFVDLEFSAYRDVVLQILDKNLLSPSGVIMVDNVFARGFVVSDSNSMNISAGTDDHWAKSGQIVRYFNTTIKDDQRVEMTLLPFFDGIAEIRWKKVPAEDFDQSENE